MKKNVFMYACGLRSNDPEALRSNLLAKLVPLCLSTRNRIFSLRDTKFRLEKSKEGTARIVMFRELNIVNSYTLEASFYGPSHVAALANRDPEPGEANGDSHMNEEHLAGLGRDLCRAILYFISPALLRRRLEEAGKLMRDMRPGPPSFSHKAGNKLAPPVAEESKETEETQAMEQAQGAFEMSEGLLDELQEYEQGEGSGDFMADVMQAIEKNPELAALAQADEDSDSGGSDALGSDNDDQKEMITARPVEIKSAQPRRPKPSPKRKLRFAQRSDSATRSRPGPLKPIRCSKPTSVPPKPPSKPSYLFQTIQQNLEALYARKSYAVKPSALQKGDSSQSFTEAESCFSQVAGEFRDVSLDSGPKLARGVAHPHYGVPPRPASGFSPGSSFIITSIHQPSQLALNPKLNGKKQLARPLPLPKSRRRHYVSANESARTESSPVDVPAARDLISQSALDHLR